jgi:O-antigen/teichoic acid export membrane protein
MNKDMLIKAISDILSLILNIMVMSIIAKNLGIFKYGVFSQITATTMILLPILLIKLNTASVRYFSEIINDKEKIKEKFLTILLIVLFFTIVICMVMYSTREFISLIIFNNAEYSNLIILTIIYIFVKVVLTYTIDFYRAINKTRYSSFFSLMRLIIISAGIGILSHYKVNIESVLSVYIFSEAMLVLIMLTVLFRGYFKNVVTSLGFSDLKKYFVYSLPLIPYSILISINQLGDRYFIVHFLGIEDAGIYSFSYSLIGTSFIVYTSIAYVIYPYISRMWTNNEMAKVKETLEIGQDIFLYIAIPITFLLIYLYPDIVRIIAGKDFIIERSLVLLIAIGHVFFGIYSIYGYVIDLSQKTFLFLKVMMVSAFLNIGLNIILIPIMGIQGAALSTFFTYLVQVVAVQMIVKKISCFKLKIDYKLVAICCAISFFSILMISLLSEHREIKTIAISIMIFLIIYIFMTYIMLFKNEKYKLRILFNG